MSHRLRFAFLVHPRTDVRRDLARGVFAPLGLIPTSAYDRVLHRLPLQPRTIATIEAADEPGTPFGSVVLVPLTPRQMLGAPRALVRRKLEEAVDYAVAQGAQIVGLGALTSPATSGGMALRGRTDVAITNGNAYTAWVTALSVRRLLAAVPARADRPVAIVGATGSVGSAVTMLLAQGPGAPSLVLVGRTQGRLDRLGAEVRAAGADVTVTTDLRDVREAGVVVLLTSAADAVLTPEHLAPGAVVVDDTQPRGTTPELLELRPDVTIIDGGLVATPGLVRRGGDLGIPDATSYACLAETSLLALAGHAGHGTLGQATVAQAELTARLAAEHQALGYGLAPPTTFGKALPMQWFPHDGITLPSQRSEVVAAADAVGNDAP